MGHAGGAQQMTVVNGNSQTQQGFSGQPTEFQGSYGQPANGVYGQPAYGGYGQS